MTRKTVKINGSSVIEGEGRDFQIVNGEIVFSFRIRGAPDVMSKPDVVVVDTHDDGILVQRDIYDVCTTSAGERMKWLRKTTEKFRSQDL